MYLSKNKMKIDSITACTNMRLWGFADLRDEGIGQIAWNLKTELGREKSFLYKGETPIHKKKMDMKE